ncbi:condensation domain-containing protein [Kitasatospora sp. NPDC004531]
MRQIPLETLDIASGRIIKWRVGLHTSAYAGQYGKNTSSASFNQDKHYSLMSKCRNSRDPLTSWLAVTFEIEGELDQNALESALLLLVQRHQVLRCEFQRNAGDLSCGVHEPDDIELEAVDMGEFDTPQEVQEFLADSFQKDMDTIFWPPFTMGAVIRESGSTTVYLAFDHIVSDGMSMANIVHDVQIAYAAYCRGEDPDLPDAPSYVEFSRDQRHRYASIDADDARLSYWKDFIARNGSVFPQFPLDLGVEPGRLYPSVNEAATLLDDRQAEALEARCRKAGGKLFMGLLAAIAVSLREEGGPDVYRALMPLSERNQGDWRHSVGWFVNTLPIEFSVAEDLDFEQILAGVQEGFTTMMGSLDVPFVRAWELLAPEHFNALCWPFPVNFMSYIDMRKCPGVESHPSWQPMSHVWVARVNGTCSWFQRDSSGLHVNSIYVDIPRARRTMTRLQHTLRETLRSMA